MSAESSLRRDLYSAFLARYVNESNQLNLKMAKEEWEPSSLVLNTCIANLKKIKVERKLISTFGL